MCYDCVCYKVCVMIVFVIESNMCMQFIIVFQQCWFDELWFKRKINRGLNWDYFFCDVMLDYRDVGWLTLHYRDVGWLPWCQENAVHFKKLPSQFRYTWGIVFTSGPRFFSCPTNYLAFSGSHYEMLCNICCIIMLF